MKKVLCIIGIVLTFYGCFVLFRESLYLEKSKERNQTYKLTTTMMKIIEEETQGLSAMKIVEYSIEKTDDLLRFSQKNDIDNGKANCVGYAKLSTAIINHAFRTNNIDGHALPVVGYVMFCGVNLCDVAHTIVPQKYKSFVKDHDFVEVRTDGKVFYFDSCLEDIIGTSCRTDGVNY